MANKILQTILNEKIEFFKYSFQNFSKEVFWDDKKNKLIHPGEFGTYRETICKDFLRLLIPNRLDISTGFIITDLDEVSSQCDIVVYDLKSTPLIKNNEEQRFFPVETVVAIGEIKSNLSKLDLVNAVNKLARNKKLKESISSPISIRREHPGYFNPKNYFYDNVFSFIICNKFKFDIKELNNELDNMYDDDIEPWQKHNLILSVEDGLLTYCDKNNKTLMYPFNISEGSLKNRIIIPDQNKDSHLNHFASYIFLGTSSASIYYPDLTNYFSGFSGSILLDDFD